MVPVNAAEDEEGRQVDDEVSEVKAESDVSAQRTHLVICLGPQLSFEPPSVAAESRNDVQLNLRRGSSSARL